MKEGHRRSAFYVFVAMLAVFLASPFGSRLVSAPAEPNNPVETIDIATLTPEANPELFEAARLLADIWRRLGFDVRVTPRPFHVHNVVTREQPWPFNIVFFGWGNRPERLDPNTFLFLPFHSTQARSGGENRIGFVNSEYDRLVDTQARTMDASKRQPIVFRAQEILADAAVMNVLWFQDVVVAYNKDRFRGFVEMPGEGINTEWSPMMVEPLTGDRTLRIAAVEEPDILNPLAMTTTNEVAFARNIFDRIARIGPDGRPKPHMARSWTIVSDTVIDITLREGLKWHDGRGVTAEDVEFTFGYLKKWPIAFFKPWLDPIKAVTATGPLSVRFELNQPFAPFLSGTLAQLFIIPKHVWKDVPEAVRVDHPDKWLATSRATIGSGPFRLIHWRRGEEALLRKHAGYFMEPKTDELLYIFYPQTDAVVGALELRRADVHVPSLQPVQLDRLRAQQHLTLTRVPAIGFSYFAFNIRKPPFDERAVRQALMSAVDYDLLIDTILRGRGVKGGPGKIFTPVNTLYNNPNVRVPAFDLNRARQLMAEAGYRWDRQGRLHYQRDR